MYCVYLMSSADNKHVYVGSTKDFKGRAHTHMSLCNRNKHQSKVQAVYNLYGREGFEFDILSEHATKAEALKHEQAWVDYYKAHPAVWNLMNLATENVDAPACNNDVKAKISAAQKGKKHSVASKAKMAAAHKGKGTKPVYVKWADGTERKFPAVTVAGKHIGVTASLVVHWLKGTSTTYYKRGIDEIRYA